MTKYEGPIKEIDSTPEEVYKFISNFDNFENIIPKEHIKEWESDGDSCRFKVDKIGNVGLKIVDKEEYKTVKYSSDGKVPFNFFLWIQLKEKADDKSWVKITIKADINPMMRMMVGSHIDKFLNVMTDAISKHKF